MWTTDRTRRAHATPRPLRVAYLIPPRPSHTLLNVLFDESMSRWGGRRTPIITTDGTTIAVADWLLLDLWDADLIYSYQPLDDGLRDRIAYCLAPATIETHKQVENWDDAHKLFPRQEQLNRALKSTSILPRLARLQEVRTDAIYEVLDKELGSEIRRDLADSFGFLSSGSIHANLGPYARRLSFREAGHERFAPRFRGDDVISYTADVAELEERLSRDGRLLVSSQMSDMFCPFLNALGDFRTSWEDCLTLVIGDEQTDRLLFWNAIHRYKALDIFRINQVFRFGLDRFQGGVPAWIEHLCGGTRNSRHLNGNGAANVQIISASLSVETIEPISRALNRGFGTMSSFRRMAASEVFEPLVGNDPRSGYEHSSVRWTAWYWHGSNATQSIRLDRNDIDLPCVKPWHVEDFPLGPTTVGSWICDLDIERTEDHSRYSNEVHLWMFPRRLGLHRAVRIEQYGPSGSSLLPPPRPTERGRLALWEDPQWRRPTLRLPQDIDAFHMALRSLHPNSVAENKHFEREGPYARIRNVALSDKGRDLLGVLRFFRNLNEASYFLTNPFVLSIIAKLSPTDTSQDRKRISKLAKELTDRFKEEPTDDDKIERAAKRVLELAARWVQKDLKDDEYISYQSLKQLMAETVEDRPEPDDLDECLSFLRNQGFLLQGYGWKCHRCQHPNWVGLTELTNSLECAICDAVEYAPVGGDTKSHFKLNPFVSAAFGPASAQDSVIWCLANLIGKARHSLLLTPTLDIKDEANFAKGTDLDVLACVDGKVHYYEVKRSFAGINQRQIEDLIQVAHLIRPDYAGFAIHNDANKETLGEEQIRVIREDLQKIDVDFVLMTGKSQNFGFFHGGVPSNVGDAMRWSVWQDE